MHYSRANDMPTTFELETPSAEKARRDRLVLDHLPLVKSIAGRIRECLPDHVDVDDLITAGTMGLIDAAAKFDESRQIVFRAYAKHRIKGAILDSLRDLDWASRDLRKRHKRFEEVTRELTAANERTPTEAEVAEKMGMDIDKWRQAALELRMVGFFSASTRSNESEDGPPPDFAATPDSNPGVMVGHMQLRTVLAGAMKSLPVRYQEVIKKYYLAGKTMREIGDTLGVNESRVSQMHKAALGKMAETLQASGIRSAECVL